MLRNPMADFEKSQEDAARATAELRIEPWMKEFVQGRHTQEEWDAFYAYCEAGPWKRRMIRWGSVLAHFLGLLT